MANKHHQKENRKEREEEKKKRHTDTKGTIESFRINRGPVLSGLNLGKMEGISFPREK